MIKCNLAVLMAERGLKIVDVAKATGISKTTLGALFHNSGKGVQFETLSTLCDFLGVGVGDLLTKIKLSAKILDTEEISSNLYKIEILINFQDQIFSSSLYVEFESLYSQGVIKNLETDLNITYWISSDLYPKLITIPREYHDNFFAKELTPKLLDLLNIKVNSYLVDSYVGGPGF
ncbi:hypothetical protein J5TS2_36900 [Brevibacillus halotolerans]|uniref:helix-turn-helix domain-containing protein n=1 Tax=Brevibacillus halotolerans TaxID=1507437 RepID=UPI001B14EAF3|nr:helix-turn-helix transcriptional regulator [Brevibacillus halotolerans]GIO03022.1 hypothetical protein J5TS2_36900 [Brevibacillus halotolerans]